MTWVTAPISSNPTDVCASIINIQTLAFPTVSVTYVASGTRTGASLTDVQVERCARLISELLLQCPLSFAVAMHRMTVDVELRETSLLRLFPHLASNGNRHVATDLDVKHRRAFILLIPHVQAAGGAFAAVSSDAGVRGASGYGG